MRAWLTKHRGDIVFYSVAFAGFVLFRSVAFAGYHIPSESMVPTLEVGDRIIVNKMAYGYSRYSLPFGMAPSFPTDDGRLFGSLPDRGDIVVFRHTKDDIVMIKRLVGLPGDEIRMVNGRLVVNGEVVPRDFTGEYRYREHKGGVAATHRFTEHLPDAEGHVILERGDGYRLDNMEPVVVPEGHVFMMGDNRDNSRDSRETWHLGFVPVENLMGRADMILFSTYRCKEEPGLVCGKRRFFAGLN
jgi:signal peptidase I